MMVIRHVVELSNVDEHGFVVDPTLARHCVIREGTLWALSGRVDPLTHLNSDFPEHTLGDCVVTETLQTGARVLTDATRRFLLARPTSSAYARLGRVDIDARRLAWLRIHRHRREEAPA
jgi:hypothetical protein